MINDGTTLPLPAGSVVSGSSTLQLFLKRQPPATRDGWWLFPGSLAARQLSFLPNSQDQPAAPIQESDVPVAPAQPEGAQVTVVVAQSVGLSASPGGSALQVVSQR